MTDYTLNPDAAKQADQIGARIDTTGKYIGQFLRAENVTSTRGTKGVEFTFKSDDGQTADYMTLWTVNPEGKELFGNKILMAVMACLKVRSMKAVTKEIEKYERDLGQKAKVPAEIYPELMGKRIGLLLQREEYERGDGSVGAKMAIFAPFEADTGFTAAEILNQATKAETLDKLQGQLKDKPIKHTGGNTGASTSGPAPTGEYFDYDIPF